MISLFNIRSPFFSPQKLDKFKRKSTFTKFNYELFKLNENLREKSRDKGFKNILPRKKTGNIYLDNMIIFEGCSKGKNRKINKKFSLILKKPKELCKTNNNQSEINLALIPLKTKIKKYKIFTSLNNENNKFDINDLERRENLKKNLYINISNSNTNLSPKIYRNNKKKDDDNYSDCQSLKGVMIDIKKKIKENTYNMNKIFDEFDKQIVQEQYLIERFYEMKKSITEKNRTNSLKKKIQNRQILSNFDKIIKASTKNLK
jgi:hypothetical protein